MGVEYYFVMKDKENMYALIVDLGTELWKEKLEIGKGVS